MEVNKEVESPINNLIEATLDGNAGAYHQLHIGLSRRLVMVPIVRLDTAFVGAGTVFLDSYLKGICSVYLTEQQGRFILPLFTSRSFLNECLNSLDVDAIPLYAADVARIVPEDVLLVLNYGTALECELNREILLSTSRGEWLGWEAGIYDELSLVSEPDEVVESAETNITSTYEPLTLEPTYGQSADMASPDNENFDDEVSSDPDLKNSDDNPFLKMRMGIDQINFKKVEADLAEVPFVRQRQGTFSKVLDALRKYRK